MHVDQPKGLLAYSAAGRAAEAMPVTNAVTRAATRCWASTVRRKDQCVSGSPRVVGDASAMATMRSRMAGSNVFGRPVPTFGFRLKAVVVERVDHPADVRLIGLDKSARSDRQGVYTIDASRICARWRSAWRRDLRRCARNSISPCSNGRTNNDGRAMLQPLWPSSLLIQCLHGKSSFRSIIPGHSTRGAFGGGTSSSAEKSTAMAPTTKAASGQTPVFIDIETCDNNGGNGNATGTIENQGTTATAYRLRVGFYDSATNKLLAEGTVDTATIQPGATGDWKITACSSRCSSRSLPTARTHAPPLTPSRTEGTRTEGTALEFREQLGDVVVLIHEYRDAQDPQYADGACLRHTGTEQCGHALRGARGASRGRGARACTCSTGSPRYLGRLAGCRPVRNELRRPRAVGG